MVQINKKLNSTAKHTKAPAGNVGLAGEMERDRKSGVRRVAVVWGGVGGCKRVARSHQTYSPASG